MKIVFATQNKGKVKEMKALLDSFDVVSAGEVGIFEDVVEDGKTFSENAMKKARFVAKESGQWSVADDSGLCIDALDGQPGIFSARWAGENDLVEFTLDKMKNVPEGKRGAYFESSVALVSPKGKECLFSGKVPGRISQKPKGVLRPKLPYDLIFIPEGYEQTFSEMTDEEKNKLSHRGKAFAKLKDFLHKEDF